MLSCNPCVFFIAVYFRRFNVRKFIETTLFEKGIKTKVSPNQIKIFEESFYLEPLLDFKSFPHCENITCEYFIVTTVVLNGLRQRIQHKTPFTIGWLRPEESELLNDELNADLDESLPSYGNAITREGNFIPNASEP